MLGDHPVDLMLLATDLGVARRFYAGTLGLEVLLEDEQFLTFRCGGDSRLVVTKSATGRADQATIVVRRHGAALGPGGAHRNGDLHRLRHAAERNPLPR